MSLSLFDNLPIHIIVHIFDYLRVEDIRQCHRVCHYWDQLLTDCAHRLPKQHLRRIEFNHDKPRKSDTDVILFLI
jgi:hypothetical protein